MTTVSKNPAYIDNSLSQAAVFWLRMAMVFAFLLLTRSLLFKVGFPIPQRLLSVVFGMGVVGSLGLGWRNIPHHIRTRLPGPLKTAVQILVVIVLLCAVYGVVRGNSLSQVGKEFLYFAIFILALQLGAIDAVWRQLEKPLLINLYLGFALILLTYKIAGVETTFSGSDEANTLYVSRNLKTLGAGLRPMLAGAYLLGAIGLVRGGRLRERLPFLGAIAALLFANCVLFGFRGTLFFAAFLFVWYSTVFGMLTRRVLVGSFLVVLVGTLSFSIYLQTSSAAQNLRARLTRTIERGELFDSRINEADVFFDDMGSEVVIGRGLGGYYRAPFAELQVKEWRSNHFGYLGYVLRGGLPLLLVNLYFIARFFSIYTNSKWRENQINQVALLAVPLFALMNCFIPFAFNPDSVFSVLGLGMCYSRSFVR